MERAVPSLLTHLLICLALPALATEDQADEAPAEATPPAEEAAPAEEAPPAETAPAEAAPAEQVPPAEEPAAVEEAPAAEEAPSADTPETAATTEQVAPAAHHAAVPPAQEEQPEQEQALEATQEEFVEAPAPTEPEPPPVDPAVHAKEAEALYVMGMELAAIQRWHEALHTLQEVVDDYADTPQAAEAQGHLRLLELLVRGGPTALMTIRTEEGLELVDPNTGEQVSYEYIPESEGLNGGRLELTISHAVLGAGLLGVLAPLALELDNPTVPMLTMNVGVAAGTLGTLAVTRRHPVTSGQAMTMVTGEALGAWNGAVLASKLDGELPLWSGAMAAGTVLGGLAGSQAAIHTRPSPGQVALVRSGMGWGLYAGAISHMLVPEETDQGLLRLGIGADAGAVVGAVLAGKLSLSRKRMLLTNLCGLGGTGLGLGAQSILASQGVDSDLARGSVLLASSAAGLAAGALLTRNTDRRLATVASAAAPQKQRRVALGTPAPLLSVDEDGQSVLGMSWQGSWR